LRAWRTEVIVGHPTLRNERTVGRLIREGVQSAPDNFPGRSVCFLVSDGTLSSRSGDTGTCDAALVAAVEGLRALRIEARKNVSVVVTPYDGYGGDFTPGKGSALKMIFDEMAGTDVSLLLLLDGDLRNDIGTWQGVFAAAARDCNVRFPGRPLFVTARYARHFVDASLTRFVVGPLTTLMGRYVPGGISGDIALSASAVARERDSDWSDSRRKYGTDIATTFDNLADPSTVVYEVYLGAKLHDITDESRLSVMPGEVIGAALERILYWENVSGCVSRGLATEEPLREPLVWGPTKTGIGFIDPGITDVFDVDVKIRTLSASFDRFAEPIRLVQGEQVLRELEHQHRRLAQLARAGDGELRFLEVSESRWISMIQLAIAYLLRTADIATAKRCLSYLYTAAYLEFVKGCLANLGLHTLSQVRAAQPELGVTSAKAESFYNERVDAAARRLALRFHASRSRIAELIAAPRR